MPLLAALRQAHWARQNVNGAIAFIFATTSPYHLSSSHPMPLYDNATIYARGDKMPQGCTTSTPRQSLDF